MMSLAHAIIYGTLDDIEMLIHQGADVNETDEYGYTPLIEAAIVNKIEIAELLIQYGANVNAQDVTGHYPLHWAADNHNIPLCKLLFEHGANPNIYSRSGQPALVMPVLRQQEQLKQLFYYYGADLNFAKDYINTKLLGHRFELDGHVHIPTPNNHLILLYFEGFLFEFTNTVIQDSLERYKNNFMAKHLQPVFNKIDQIVIAFAIAAELMKYRQYTININLHQERISNLIDNDPLVIPITYEGHAITCIKFGSTLVKCDRGMASKTLGHTTMVYKINRPEMFTEDLVRSLIYKTQDEYQVHSALNDILGLSPLFEIPIPPQITGNCSWANVEAAIPALFMLLQLRDQQNPSRTDIATFQKSALDFFTQWREWDKDRALDECVQSFHYSNLAAKASKAAILANILVHRLKFTHSHDVQRAEKILAILYTPDYKYILDSYIQVYNRDPEDPTGKNLRHLLDLASPHKRFF